MRSDFWSNAHSPTQLQRTLCATFRHKREKNRRAIMGGSSVTIGRRNAMWEGRLSAKGTKAKNRTSLRFSLTEKSTFKRHNLVGVSGGGEEDRKRKPVGREGRYARSPLFVTVSSALSSEGCPLAPWDDNLIKTNETTANNKSKKTPSPAQRYYDKQ